MLGTTVTVSAGNYSIRAAVRVQGRVRVIVRVSVTWVYLSALPNVTLRA